MRLFFSGAAIVFGCMAWTATEWPLGAAATTALLILLALGLGSIVAGAISFTRTRDDLPPARVSRSTRRRGG